jgi:GNAT superfamily N-acetyltransferase
MNEWLSSSLTAEHETANFDSGIESLDTWLRNHARRAQQANTSRTYVWTAQGDLRVVAYYSIAPTQMLRDVLTSGQAGGSSVVPGYLLGRLALDRSLHGQGLGTELLLDALDVIVKASTTGGGRLIVVEAIDEAARHFYEHHNFQPIKGHANRLVMKVSTARQALGATRIRVSADRDAQLVSIVFDLPNGTSTAIVASPAESRAIAQKLIELHDQSQEGEPLRVNLTELFREVLDRDPFVG